jgi:hypothetical protein
VERLEADRYLSTPSLGITPILTTIGVVMIIFFQLPLSGSRIFWIAVGQDRVSALSTPSLGITAVAEQADVFGKKAEFVAFQLPLSGSP